MVSAAILVVTNLRKGIQTNMKSCKNRSAFTMIELIFVITILGIIASIGSELIAKVYASYIVQRAEHRATLKTGLAAIQIANRLASAIPGTVYRRNQLSGGVIENINDSMSLPGDQYIALQWVGTDVEGFNFYDDTANKIAWSGFCDINVSTDNLIKTPGSKLALISTLMTNFGYTNKFAIYFPYDITPYYVNSVSGNIITLDNNASHIVEHYKVARTSYALVAETNATSGVTDLYLYYNFIPTPAPSNNIPTSGPKALLMKNLSSFKFKGAGRTIRFKICKEERISEDVNITACKEKAVF